MVIAVQNINYIQRIYHELISWNPMQIKTRILTYLIIFAVFDMIIPIPLTSIILIYVVLEKPDWFKNLVSEIYIS